MPDVFTVSDTVLAAMIAAATTLLSALLNLRWSWKKELKERERGQPITKKSRRGPVFAILLLMVACTVGGFAFSQYLMVREGEESRGANEETRAALTKLIAATERLERAAAANSASCSPAVPRLPEASAALSPQ